MNILPTLYRESIHFFEQSFLPQLNAQQKKISAIALLAFSCLSACYLLYFCCFKARKGELLKDPLNISLKDPQNIPEIKVEAEISYKQGMNVFSFEVLQQIIGESQTENKLISPLGISLLISMIKHGISQEDQKEIERVIHLPQDESECI